VIYMFEDKFIVSVTKLTGFISKNKFDSIPQRTPYYHMGATITDSVLQAGLNYRQVVYPRILKLLKEFPDYKTTCDFVILMQVFPLKELISWRNEKKLERIKTLSWFFYDNQIENEDHLALWMNNKNNLLKLAQIEGVGPKTIDYLKMLSGNQAIAVDRHLFKFLELADITIETYQEANAIYCKAAEMLKISQYELDRKVWLFMSKA
jgi:endonuclease III